MKTNEMNLKESPLYPAIVMVEPVDFMKIEQGYYIRTTLGRIVRVVKKSEEYCVVNVRNRHLVAEVKIKRKSITRVSHSLLGLLQEDDFVFVVDPENGYYGKFQYIQEANTKRTRQVAVKKDSEVFLINPEKIVDVLTQNALFYGLKGNEIYHEGLIE